MDPEFHCATTTASAFYCLKSLSPPHSISWNLFHIPPTPFPSYKQKEAILIVCQHSVSSKLNCVAFSGEQGAPTLSNETDTERALYPIAYRFFCGCSCRSSSANQWNRIFLHNPALVLLAPPFRASDNRPLTL